MNLTGMGASGMDNVSAQIAASTMKDDYGGQGGNMANNAGMINAMANV